MDRVSLPAAVARVVVATLCAVLVASGTGCTGKVEFDGERAWTWVAQLAGDHLQGRRTGTPEGDEAAALIAGAFRDAGLEPAGADGGYLHRFEFPFYRFVQPVSLSLGIAGQEVELTWGEEYYFLNGSSPGTGSAQVVYAGFGLASEEYDDYAGIDVRGKIVLAMQGLPKTPALERSLASNVGKAAAAHARGALGLVLFGDPALGSTFPETRIWVFRPERYLEDFLIVKVDVPVAERLLGGNANSLKEAIDSSGAPASRSLETRVRWQVSVEYRPEAQGANVLALLPGRDPELADELVLVGAHYDGGGPDPDGTIYNGAEDNASGTGALLELARVMALGPDPVRRSVMFAAWGAEEQGVWGSTRFLEDQVWPLDRIALTFTLDNVGMGDGAFRLFGAHNFPEEYKLIAAGIEAGLLERFTPRGAGGSDGWPFQRRGIPALFAHADASQPFVHTPDDDASTISPDMLGIVGRFMRQAVVAAANAPSGAFPREDRLVRYLSRYAFVAGWVVYGPEEQPDWQELQDRDLDLLVVETGSLAEVARIAAGVPQDVQIVTASGDLSSTEAGTALRVVFVTATDERVAMDPGALRASPVPTLLVRREDAMPGIVTLVPTAAIEGHRAVEIRLVSSSADVPSVPMTAGGPELVIDASAGMTAATLIAILLDKGVDPETIQQVVGNRLRAEFRKVLGTS